MKPKFWLLRGLKFIFFAALFVTAIVFLTHYLWNSLVPELFHGPALNYSQTFGLLLLSRLLLGFRGGRPGGWARHRRAWKQKMANRLENLSTDEREKFRQQMRQRCGVGWMKRPQTSEATVQ